MITATLFNHYLNRLIFGDVSLSQAMAFNAVKQFVTIEVVPIAWLLLCLSPLYTQNTNVIILIILGI
jgi:hypothetical protein